MKETRLAEINKVQKPKRVGIAFGILGRQGSRNILEVKTLSRICSSNPIIYNRGYKKPSMKMEFHPLF